MPVEVAVEASHPGLAPAVAVVFDQDALPSVFAHSACPELKSVLAVLAVSAAPAQTLRQRPRATLAGVALESAALVFAHSACSDLRSVPAVRAVSAAFA